METADVLVVGAGITGCATAHALVTVGAGRVRILDKAHVAGGPTGRSSGVVRQFYTHPTLVQMAKEGRDTYAHFDERAGGDAGFVQCGWLLAVGSANRDTAEEGLRIQQRVGVPSRWVSAEEAATLSPGLMVDDLVGGVYEEDGGYADPPAAAQAYLDQARALGATYVPGVEVTGWQRSGDDVVGVETSAGPISSGMVVLAAGPWAVPLVSLLGIHLPITASQHAIVVLREPGRPARPVLSDPVNLVYCRPEGRALTLVGSNDPADAQDLVDPDRCPALPPWAKVEAMLEAVNKRIPALGDAEITGHWSGVYDVSEDGFPILGPLPGVSGLVVATGMSGHGFKLAPAIAATLAGAVVGRGEDPRLRLFRFSRFSEGEPIRSITTSSLTAMRH
ncbi:MAG: NAD(P)/FAD-dependent oxidoreductase [Acidimicrobiales bacterium]